MTSSPVAFYSEEFFDQQEVGTLNSARIILGELWPVFRPASVIDVGCGVAPWLRAASDLGARITAGIDGDYVRQDRLLVDRSVFYPCNLESGSLATVFPQQRNFDLVMCLEVAEHLSEARASSFVTDLCALGDLVLFSAAVPGQGGMNHINEQWPSYWSAFFKKNGLSCFDILRPKVWNNSVIEWWYAQNVFLFVRNGSPAFETLLNISQPTQDPLPLVHPRMHAHVLNYAVQRTRELEQLVFLNPFGRDDHIRMLEDKIDTLRSMVTETRDDLQTLVESTEVAKRKHEELERVHALILSSTSWRITAPFRALRRALGRG